MSSSPAGRLGRTFAWAFAGLVIVAGVLVTVVSSGLPPTEPDLAKHYAYVRQIWPGLYISFLLFMAASLCLIPVGLVLREVFGRSLRSELLYASFLAAGILGVVWMLAQAGSAQAVVNDTAGATPQNLTIISASSSIWSAVINWLQRGFLILASLGAYWTGRAALQSGLLPRALGWLSVMLAAFYWLGLFSLLLRDLDVAVPCEASSILVGLTAVLALAWAVWLGWVLGRAARTE